MKYPFRTIFTAGGILFLFILFAFHPPSFYGNFPSFHWKIKKQRKSISRGNAFSLLLYLLFPLCASLNVSVNPSIASRYPRSPKPQICAIQAGAVTE